jgi:methionyl-tRNA synthetase
MISIDKFLELDIRIGEVLEVEKVPDTEKLLKLKVDVGEENPRTIVSGIALFFEDPQILVGKKMPFLTNLESRMLRGIESQGMILASSTEDFFSLLEAHKDTPNGSKVK